MIRRPPRSTLFPTRRSSDLVSAFGQDTMTTRYASWDEVFDYCRRSANPIGRRSEEHTSELQSQSNLVCRLLLEKKNKEGRFHDEMTLASQSTLLTHYLRLTI